MRQVLRKKNLFVYKNIFTYQILHDLKELQISLTCFRFRKKSHRINAIHFLHWVERDRGGEGDKEGEVAAENDKERGRWRMKTIRRGGEEREGAGWGRWKWWGLFYKWKTLYDRPRAGLSARHWELVLPAPMLMPSPFTEQWHLNHLTILYDTFKQTPRFKNDFKSLLISDQLLRVVSKNTRRNILFVL